MNALCYKIVFSKRLGTLVAVGEHTVGQGKTASGSGVRNVVNGAVISFIGALNTVFAAIALTFLTASFTASVGFAAGPAANALPSGASVNSGSVAISSTSSSNAATMNITQTTDKASVNWNSFNIGSAARVNVQQNSASSVLLNRVVGNDPSQIFGKLSANGQVILINPNGIVFGSGGSVTASAFTASTFGLSDADLQAGKYKYSRNGSTAGVTVEGGASLNATAPGGYVALMGASVDNQGLVSTQGGAVVMASGESVALPASLTNNISVPLSGKVRLELLPSTINAMVANSGTITTEGGQVLMQAAALSDAVASITHTGTIDTTGAQGGAVTLLADGGVIKATGNITANSSGNDELGHQRKGGDIIIGRDEETGVLAKTTDVSGANLETKGGFIETSGHDLKIDGAQVKAANWLLDPDNIDITNSTAATGYSKISASTLSAALTSGTNITVNTTGGVSGASGVNVTGTSATGSTGNIKVTDAIGKTSAGEATLNLIADDSIDLGNSITSSGTGAGKLNINLTAAKTISGTGNLSANGGNITLTSTDSASTGTLSGSIAAAQLTKAGAGKIIQTGALTTSAVNVNAGTWEIGNGTTNGSVAIASGSSAVAFGIASGATLSYNVKTGTTFNSVSSTYTGSGTLQKEGTGVLKWGAGNGTFAMSSGSLIDVINGTFVGGDSFGEVWTNNMSRLNVAENAGFSGAESDVRVGVLTGNGSVSSGWTTLGSFTMGVDNATTDATFSGTLISTGGSGLIKTGIYKQILTGNSSSGGTTKVNGGTLQIGNGGSTGTLGTGAVTLANGANLSYQRNVATTIANAITGVGNVTANITAGGLTVNNGINLTTGNITLTGSNAATDGVGVKINGVTLKATIIDVTGTATGANGGQSNAKGIQSAGTLSATNNITLKGTSTNTTGVGIESGSVTAGGAVVITAKNTTGVFQGANIGGAVTGKSVEIKGDSTGNVGVSIAAAVTSTNGAVTIKGTSIYDRGVYVGNNTLTSKITSNSGAITITGKSTQQQGVLLDNNSTINADGDVNITGTNIGTTTAANKRGVELKGVISATKNVSIVGSITNAANNSAAALITKTVTASTGKIDITTSTKGGTNNALNLAASSSLIAATAVNIRTDSLFIDATASPATINAGTGTVTIKTDTAAAKIDIGNGTGTSGVDLGSGTLTLGLTNTELNRITAGNLVIGDTSNTGGITVSAATTINATTGNVTLQTGGNIAVSAALTVGDAGATKNLTFNGAGATSTITQTAAIKAAGLELLGANATHTLTNTGNQVTTLAASTRAIDYFNSGALTLGSVNTEGINASGDVSIATGTGNLTITKNVVTTATSATALKLNAAKSAAVGAAVGSDISGNIIVSGGSVFVGTGGTAQLMTGSITGNTTAAGLASSGNFRYNSDETTTNYSKALDAKGGTNNGINVVYREKPTLTVKVNDVTKTYDGLTYSGGSFNTTATAGNLVNSDTVATVTGNSTFAGAAQGKKNVVDSGTAITASDTLSKNALGYAVTYTDGTLTISKATLALALADQNKVYDGSVTAAITAGGITATGVTVGGNTESVAFKAVTGAYNSKNVATANSTSATVSASDVNTATAVNGLDLGNYTVPTTVSNNASTITPRPLKALYTATDKVFDGNSNATVTGTLKDIVTGDAVTATHTSATFDTAAVGTNKTVTVAGIALTGGDASNYKIDPVVNLGNTATAKANITAAASIPPAPVVPTSASSSGRVKIPTPTANPFQLASAEELGEEDFCSDGSSGNSNSSCTCEESKLAQDAQICFEKNTQKISAQ
jgi:filamentous hemagglutinin family protein